MCEDKYILSYYVSISVLRQLPSSSIYLNGIYKGIRQQLFLMCMLFITLNNAKSAAFLLQCEKGIIKQGILCVRHKQMHNSGPGGRQAGGRRQASSREGEAGRARGTLFIQSIRSQSRRAGRRRQWAGGAADGKQHLLFSISLSHLIRHATVHPVGGQAGEARLCQACLCDGGRQAGGGALLPWCSFLWWHGGMAWQHEQAGEGGSGQAWAGRQAGRRAPGREGADSVLLSGGWHGMAAGGKT